MGSTVAQAREAGSGTTAATAATTVGATRGWVLALGAAVLAGVALGGGSSAANVFGSPYGPFTRVEGEGVGWLQLLSTWLDSLWAWVLLPLVVGWWVARPVRAAVAGTVALLVAVVAYYAGDRVLGFAAQLEVVELRYWAVMALLAGPVMGVLGVLARRRGVAGLSALLVAPAAIVGVVAQDRRWSGPAQPWSSAAVLTLAAGLTVWSCLRFVRDRRQGRPSAR